MDLRQLNDIEYTPMKGDNVSLNDRLGILIDENNFEIEWNDSETEIFSGGWVKFIEQGGFILVI
jgi:hypothetical protein